MSDYTNISSRMQAELVRCGLVVEHIQADGKWKRCGVMEDERGKAGSYKAFLDHNPGLLWSNFKTGEHGKWFAKSEKDMTAKELEEWKERARQAQKEQEEARRKAARKANWYMGFFPKAGADNGYLKRKGVLPFGELRQMTKGQLVVPVYDASGKVVSVQRILPKKPEGKGKTDKFFLSDGYIKGGFFPISAHDGGTDGPLLIAEGYATAASLRMATGFEVWAAFNAGNLLPVGQVARAKYPQREIMVCGDNDLNNKKPDGSPYNPGKEKAEAAARAIGAKLALCPSVGGKNTDFNDLHMATDDGLDKVRVVIEKARKGEGNVKKPAYKCLNIAELVEKEYPPRRPLLAPVFAVQSLSMVYASRGVGKTHFALSCAYAVASGGGVFGRWFAPSPARVLYIDGEMPAVTLKKRLQAIALGADETITDPDLFRIFTPDEQEAAMPNLATQEGQEAVEPFLEGVSLVVVDNLATLARTGKANDEDSWKPVQTWLLDLRRRGISVLLVHHSNKNGSQRGTGAKEDILDNVLELRHPSDYKPEDGARFEVHFSKARGLYGEDVEPFEASLVFDEQGQFTWATRRVEDVVDAKISDLLQEGFSERDIMEELKEDKVGRTRIQRVKRQLQDKGINIAKSKGGAGTHKARR